jgi:hypothetical protein
MVESKFSTNVYMAEAHGGWLLTPYPTALRPCRRGTRGQEPIPCARPCIAAPGPCRRGARRQEPVTVGLGGRVFFLVF